MSFQKLTSLKPQSPLHALIDMDYMVGGRSRNAWLEIVTYTVVGAADAITFAQLGLPDMADTNYTVNISGNSTAQLNAATRATTGFSLALGSAADVIVLTIIGKPADKV